MPAPVLVGAVVYDPKVVTIWEIIKRFFEENGCPMDFTFYSNYELQNDSLIKGSIDIAWNSPLAWIDALNLSGGKCRAIAMRDTDRDRRSHWVVRADGPIQSIGDLAGKRVATGAKDSPQATLIPLNLLENAGIDRAGLQVQRFDVLVGKHGDHVGGEKDAFGALAAGDVDACAMLDLNYQAWSADGTLDAARYRILATTDPFDHCVFTVTDRLDAARESEWLATLMQMSYDNPDHREMMDMEGLKQWLPGRTEGFAQLSQAVARQGYPNR